MNKNLVIGAIVVIIVVVIGFMWFSNQNQQTVEDITEIPMETSRPTVSTAATTADTVKEFTVTGSNFKFSPTEMKVKQGDTVRVIFKNSGGAHDWKLDEFNAATKMLQSGQEETIEFVANKTGTFEYYCSVGTHRQMGMKGNLIVE